MRQISPILSLIAYFCVSTVQADCGCSGVVTSVLETPRVTVVADTVPVTSFKPMLSTNPVRTPLKKIPLLLGDLPLETAAEPEESEKSTEEITTAAKPETTFAPDETVALPMISEIKEEENAPEPKPHVSAKPSGTAGLPKQYPPEKSVKSFEKLMGNASRKMTKSPAPETIAENAEDSGVRGQSPRKSSEEALMTKPDPPGNTVSVDEIPGGLLNDPNDPTPEEKPNESRPETRPTFPENSQGEAESGKQQTQIPGVVIVNPPESGGVVSQGESEKPSKTMHSQGVVTALVLLSALSTLAFFCMIFVVQDYRRRWLDSIMSQNGIATGGMGALGASYSSGAYMDIPSLSGSHDFYHREDY